MPDEQRPPAMRHRSGARTSAVVASVAKLADERRSRLGRALAVLDLGGGTGGVAVPLAEAGHHVVVVDPSPDALASLARRARESGIENRVTALQGDGDQLAASLAGREFDLVCCHGALEFVDDPESTLRAIQAALVPGGLLSLLVSGRLAVVLAKTIAGDFEQARTALLDPAGRWGATDPLSRRFDPDQVEALLAGTGFTVSQIRGTDILGHLVPSAHLDSEQSRAAVAELDDLLVEGPGREFLRTLGHGIHVIAHRG